MKMLGPGSEGGFGGDAQVNLTGNDHERTGDAENNGPPDVMDLFREMMSKLDKTREDTKSELNEAMKKIQEKVNSAFCQLKDCGMG